MQVLDASSIVYGWDNYPIKNFPKLWDWLSIQIGNEDLVIPTVAYQEVHKVSPDCGIWLGQQSISQLQPSSDILHNANRIKGLIGVVDDQYGPTGVGENDLIIITTAKAHGGILISDEKRQSSTPGNPANRKIPAVCDMPQVGVKCINFLEYITSSGAVFG